MSKHTPGPWEAMWTNDVGPDDEYYVEFYEILDAKGNRVGTAEEKHDAVLMAEAPKLLEALESLLEMTGEPPDWNCTCHLTPPCIDCVDYSGWRNAFKFATSVLAKATGGQA